MSGSFRTVAGARGSPKPSTKLAMDKKFLELLFMGPQYESLKYWFLLPKGRKVVNYPLELFPTNQLLIQLTLIRLEVVGKRRFCWTDLDQWMCYIFSDTPISSHRIRTCLRKVLSELEKFLAIDDDDATADLCLYCEDYFDDEVKPDDLNNLRVWRESIFFPIAGSGDTAEFKRLKNCCYELT